MSILPLYQLLDSDNTEYGLLATDCPIEKVKELWHKYYCEDFAKGDVRPSGSDWAEDLSADGFAAYLEELGYEAERLFVENISPFEEESE